MCYILGDQHLISGRSAQVVKTKKTRSATVISLKVVSRRDGCSKVHSRRIWYSMFLVQDAFSLRMLLFLALWALPLCSLCPAVFQIARATTRLQFTTVPICHDSRLLGVHDHDSSRVFHDSRPRLFLDLNNLPSLGLGTKFFS